MKLIEALKELTKDNSYTLSCDQRDIFINSVGDGNLKIMAPRESEKPLIRTRKELIERLEDLNFDYSFYKEETA